MASTDSRRELPARNLDFGPLLDDLPKHLAVEGDLVTSHLIAVLSAVFPDGEAYFIRSVAAVRHEIDDRHLLDRVSGFVGQEAHHGREHRALNARLASFGYPTAAMERYVRAVVTACERFLSIRTNVAVTAGLEHYTATLAAQLLGDPAARGQIGHEGVRSMFLWHALEESEHKAVAFDVYREIGGSDRLRILTMYLINAAFVVEVSAWTAVSLLTDRDTRRHPISLLRSLWRLRRSPFLTRDALIQVLDYTRQDFHPDDHDTTGLIDSWRSRLFGPGGTLAGEVVG